MTTRPSQWSVIFDTQWKWTRGIALLAVIVAFAIPVLSVYFAAQHPDERIFIRTMQGWGVGYAIVAAGLGLIIGLIAWSQDHRLRHVYVLSLPIARWKYVLMRFTSGLVLLMLPVVALFVGAEIVAHTKWVPTTLHAYPVALTLRFAFATLVAYAVFFAIASATAKTAGYILGGLAAVAMIQFVLSVSGTELNVVQRVVDIVFAAPGLLAVFSGRWMLVDV
jgi:hypothetical protein